MANLRGSPTMVKGPPPSMQYCPEHMRGGGPMQLSQSATPTKVRACLLLKSVLNCLLQRTGGSFAATHPQPKHAQPFMGSVRLGRAVPHVHARWRLSALHATAWPCPCYVRRHACIAAGNQPGLKPFTLGLTMLVSCRCST